MLCVILYTLEMSSVTEKDTKNENEMHVTKDAHKTDVTDKDTNGQMDVEEPVKRRTVKLTAKALACKIEKVQKDRHSYVKQMKELRATMRELMKVDECDVQKDVKSSMEKLNDLYKNAKAEHALIVLIPKEELENQTIWFEHVKKYHNDFMEDVRFWLAKDVIPMHEITNVGGTIAAKSVTQAILHAKMPIVRPKETAAASLEMLAGQQMENTVGHQEQMPFTNIEQSLKTHKDVACDLPETLLQDTVRTCDSMSNLSKRSRGSRTASSRLRAEADTHCSAKEDAGQT